MKERNASGAHPSPINHPFSFFKKKNYFAVQLPPLFLSFSLGGKRKREREEIEIEKPLGMCYLYIGELSMRQDQVEGRDMFLGWNECGKEQKTQDLSPCQCHACFIFPSNLLNRNTRRH